MASYTFSPFNVTTNNTSSSEDTTHIGPKTVTGIIIASVALLVFGVFLGRLAYKGYHKKDPDTMDDTMDDTKMEQSFEEILNEKDDLF